jgi:hypothetical protein
MSDEGGGGDLAEILLGLSPLPSSLPRTSVASKRRERLATARSFHRRFLAHHRKSPILGVFEKYSEELVFSSVLDLPCGSTSISFTRLGPGLCSGAATAASLSSARGGLCAPYV